VVILFDVMGVAVMGVDAFGVSGGSVRRSSWGLDRLSRRLRWVAPVAAVALVVGLLASAPVPAAAAVPVLPPGASLTPPVQRMAAAPTAVSVPTEATHDRRGAGAPVSVGRPVHPVPALMVRPQDRVVSAAQARVEADRRAAGVLAKRSGLAVEGGVGADGAHDGGGASGWVVQYPGV
jgi:hypothetical protein